MDESDLQTVNQVAANLADELIASAKRHEPMICDQYNIDETLLKMVHGNMFIRCAAIAVAELYGLDVKEVGRAINSGIETLLRSKRQ